MHQQQKPFHFSQDPHLRISKINGNFWVCCEFYGEEKISIFYLRYDQQQFIRFIKMGCFSSTGQLEDIDPKMTPCVRNISDRKKDLIIPTIEDNDLLSMAVHMDSERIFPHSEVSDSGMLWMLTHMCCRWDAAHCLEYLLKQYFAENPKGYIDFVNAPTVQGYTCLHLCGMWKADRCFGLLLNFGGLNLKALDKMRKTPLETALDYHSKKISETLEKFKSLNIDFLQIDTQKLIGGSILEEKEILNTKQSEEKFEYKFDKNLHGVTANLFDFTAKEKEVVEEQKRKKIQREKILAEKARKKQQQLRKKKQREQKMKQQKEEEAKKQNLAILTQLVSDFVQEKQIEDQEFFSSDEEEDEQIKKMNEDIEQRSKELRRVEMNLNEIRISKFNKIKQEENTKNFEIFNSKRVEISSKIEQKNQFLRLNAPQILQKRQASVRSRIAERKQIVSESIPQKNQLPPELSSLYESAKKKGKFDDHQFPAKNSSIGNPSTSKFKNLTQNLVWLRPSDIFNGKEYKLFDGIDPNDIKQGSLGVCYMLATLSSLAANPKNIEKIFVFYDLQIGFYVLRLYINGIPKHIVVDDCIPCSKFSKAPLFTKPIGNQVWVLLMEKAWAKVIGNYLSAESMTPDHMMEDLSGAPGYGGWFKNEGGQTKESKLQQCVKHDQMGHIIVITSVADKKIEGIANNHAYAMLKTYKHKSDQIYKIRNPWGRFEWNGKYGENSSEWTSQLQNLVKFERKDDGVFFLSSQEVLEAFCYYSISQINPDFKYSFLPFTSGNREDIFFKVTLNKDSEMNLRITQPFKRMITDPDYNHSPMAFEVGKIENDGSVTFLSEGHSRTFWGAKSVHAFPDITKQLTKGSYLVRIRMLWKNSNKYNSAVLAAYANQSVEIHQLPPAEATPLWKSLLIDFCKSHSDRKTNNIIYKVVTMKGQFVFPIYTESEARVVLKFDRAKFNLVDMGLSAISGTELQMKAKKGVPDVGTMDRTQPAKGGSTGQFFINVS